MTEHQDIEELRLEIKETASEMRGHVEARVAEKTEDTPETRLPTDKVLGLVSMGEEGLGIAYRELQAGKFVFDNRIDCWLKFDGHSWALDIMRAHLAAVGELSDRLANVHKEISTKSQAALEAGDDTEYRRAEKQRKSVRRAVRHLQTVRGRKNVVEMARTTSCALAIRGDEVDRDPLVVGCSNGVVRLDTSKLRPGRPEDYITRACPVDYPGYFDKCPVWEETLRSCFDEDEMTLLFIQRMAGYALTGLTREHRLFVLWGEGGNGKSVFVETLLYVMGPLAGVIRPELILRTGRTASADAATPSLLELFGRRFVVMMETDQEARISESRAKWLSSSDTISGRGLYDRREIQFRPTHKLFLLTNHKPHAAGDDYAFWRRVILIPFNVRFVEGEPQGPNERPARKDLMDALKAEAPGILAWMVRGAKMYLADGLNPPDSIQAATRQYQRDEDLLGNFVDDRCRVGDHLSVPAADIFEAFSTWYEEVISKKGISQKKAGTLLGKRFDKVKVNGRVVYRGLELV